ncbi:L,D-transpeptidase [Methylobacterium nigriterrae]|uniref:L,D-transpeptidase n=1 Tax=Methylobacterium nigriterrae TaxID=3127512 RepID=UPI00301397B6
MRLCLSVALSSLLLTTVFSPPAMADVRITVDKAEQRMSVSVDGRQRYSWPVSTGVKGHDTPSGSYQPFRMERDHFSKEWDDAPMPHAIFFTAQGHAIHGTNHTGHLGRPASHGCVRLSPKNAATLFSLVKAEGPGNTGVTIEGGAAVVARRKDKGIKVAHRKPRYETGGVMSAGLQMGAEAADGYDYGPVPVRRAYRRPPAEGYAYGPAYLYDAPGSDGLD